MATRGGPKRPKHEPLRSCMGCGAKRPKRELVRVVRTPSGAVEIDPTGRRAGRGAYVCPTIECLKAAVKGKRLERALETPVPDEVLETLTRAVEASAGTAGRTAATRSPGGPTASNPVKE